MDSETKKADISAQQMIDAGWIKTGDSMTPYEKKIENRNPINSTPEDSDIKLIVHGMYNVWTFAVLLPDGGMLNFVANSMDDLNQCLIFMTLLFDDPNDSRNL